MTQRNWGDNPCGPLVEKHIRLKKQHMQRLFGKNVPGLYKDQQGDQCGGAGWVRGEAGERLQG